MSGNDFLERMIEEAHAGSPLLGRNRMEFSTKLKDQIERAFTYHAPAGDQQARYSEIRDDAKTLAYTFAKHCPESRELSSALTRLEEAVMHANASIARSGVGAEARDFGQRRRTRLRHAPGGHEQGCARDRYGP